MASCHPVSRGHVYLCLPSLSFGAAGAEKCPVRPLATLPGRLEEFLFRLEPLRGCRRCLGTSGNKVPHVQVPAKKWRSFSLKGKADPRLMARVRKDPYLSSDLYSDSVSLPWKKEGRDTLSYDADWQDIFSLGALGRSTGGALVSRRRA